MSSLTCWRRLGTRVFHCLKRFIAGSVIIAAGMDFLERSGRIRTRKVVGVDRWSSSRNELDGVKLQRGGKDRSTVLESLRGLGKSFDAPPPRGRVSNPPLRIPFFLHPWRSLRLIFQFRIFYSVVSVVKCLLPFGCGRAALELGGELATADRAFRLSRYSSAADRAAGRAEFPLLRR